MAILISTNNAMSLLQKIKTGIDNGSIDTWVYDKDGDFTHTPEQWKNKAWLKPMINSGELRLGILKPRDVDLSKTIYGIYHGRFIEMLLTHFDSDFSNVYATANKLEPDNF